MATAFAAGASADADDVALSAHGITKRFDGKLANDHVDFVARRGEVHALLGENGAGKTTLISVLCGQYRPDEGTIEVGGVPQRFGSPRDALRAGVGVIHQDLRQVDRFSVVENVVLGTDERVSKAAEKRVAEIAADLGFDIQPGAIVGRLTVGERQQLEIVKLLYRGLRTLILDEPTAVLAPQQSEQLFRALRVLADSGKAVVFITHRLREVIAAADVVTVLREGRVVAHRPVGSADPSELTALMFAGDTGQEVVAEPGRPAHPVLELRDVSCGAGRRALQGVDLTVCSGEIVGIAGVSGNGQVELAEVAVGMLEVERGSRHVAGDGAIGFIPEDRLATGLVGSMTIAENLAFRRFRRAPMSSRFWLRRRAMRVHADDLIERFRIPASDTTLPVAALSGGGLQRIIVAREMTEEPDLLVASQPTRGLDVVSAELVRRQMLAARDRGAAVLLISEDLDELLQLSDRIAVMLGGRIVSELPRGTVSHAQLGRYMTGSDSAAEA